MTKMSFVSSEMFPRERLSGYWLCGRAWVGWIVCCWCNDCINLLNIIAICCLALKQRDFVAACTREERLKQCTVAVRRLTNEAIKVEETQPRRNAKKRKRERERRDWWNLNDRATLCQLLVHRVINLKTSFTVFISRKTHPLTYPRWSLRICDFTCWSFEKIAPHFLHVHFFNILVWKENKKREFG